MHTSTDSNVSATAPVVLHPDLAAAQEFERFAIPAPRVVTSRSLLEGSLEVQIEHRGAIYRLRQTALGKLILTK